PYTMHDVAFLRAAASQMALAMTNAGAFARLESLNASLEQQVHERTASLAKANVDLGRSLTELRTAYQQLERNQASLMRAERLATLGAHEARLIALQLLVGGAQLGERASEVHVGLRERGGPLVDLLLEAGVQALEPREGAGVGHGERHLARRRAQEGDVVHRVG